MVFIWDSITPKTEYTITRNDGHPKGRHYIINNSQEYPSVTNFLSSVIPLEQWIINWRNSVGEKRAAQILKMASQRGNDMHNLCESYLKNEIQCPSVMPMGRFLFNNIKPYLTNNISTVYLSEGFLYSDLLQLAGTVDCVAVYRNKISVVDFKTATSIRSEDDIFSYRIQCVIYALMVSELYGLQIEQCVILMSSESGKVKEYIFNPRDYYIELKSLLKAYKYS